MVKIKYILGSGAASLALALGVALPASAATQSNDCSASKLAATYCSNKYVDYSKNYSKNLGNGSAIIDNDVHQYQKTYTTTVQGNLGAGVGTGVGGSAVSTSSSTVLLGHGSSASWAAGGAGTGVGTNVQSNSSSTTVTSTQNGGVWFGN